MRGRERETMRGRERERERKRGRERDYVVIIDWTYYINILLS
jgi:hypothetical protein